jgi:HEAT repeat protein
VAAFPVVLEMAKNNENVVQPAAQVAAIRALAGLPNDEVVEFLLAAATGDNDANATAADDALTRMKSPGLEQKIIARLEQSPGRAGIPLVQVCRLRQISAATPVLLPLLSDADDAVRLAAIAALGNTVSGESIEVLFDHLLNPASDTEFQAVRTALLAVCHRAVDPDTIATKLAVIYEGATLQAQIAMLELFGALGGGVAVESVHRAIMDPTEEIQDTATRILGTWPDTGAATVLLAVMESDADERFRIRALRGYIRIIRQMDTSNEHRFHMSMEALARAQRDDEILLIVDALGRIPTHASLMKLLEFLDKPTFAEQAATSGIAVGRALIAPHPNEVGVVMRKILEVSEHAEARRIAEEILGQL